MFLFFQSQEFERKPGAFVLANLRLSSIAKSISKGKIKYFNRKREIYPYGNGFSTESAAIIDLSEPIYYFEGKFYEFTAGELKEIKNFVDQITVIKELTVQKGCKYRIFEVKIESNTKSGIGYMVEPK